MRIVLSSVFFAGLAVATAHAADAVIDYQPAPVVYDSFNWTGFYVGGQLGYGFSGDNRNFYYYGAGGIAPLADDYYGYNTSPDGFFAGLHAGYNHQFSNQLVLGVETELNWSDVSGSGFYDEGGDVDEDYIGTFDLKWFGSTRARVGFAHGRLLPFLTAGVAYGKFRFDENDTADASFFSAGGGGTLVGWSAGAGLEYALTNNWTIRGEYRYTDFGNKDFVSFYNPVYSTGINDDYRSRLSMHDIRIGASYKF